MPFAMLLLVVFLYRHLVSILTFFWLTSLLHNGNERMRRERQHETDAMEAHRQSQAGRVGVATPWNLAPILALAPELHSSRVFRRLGADDEWPEVFQEG